MTIIHLLVLKDFLFAISESTSYDGWSRFNFKKITTSSGSRPDWLLVIDKVHFSVLFHRIFYFIIKYPLGLVRHPQQKYIGKCQLLLSNRQNPRHFTTVNNSGVKHQELLVSVVPTESDNTSSGLNDAVLQEVHRLASDKHEIVGLVECYRKICKVELIKLTFLFYSSLS